MIDMKELTPIKAQVSKLENQATSVVIESQEDYAQAIDIVGNLKETGSEIKRKKESITKPLNDALRSARELFKPLESQFEKAEKIIKDKLLAYKRKKDEEAKAEEAKIGAKVVSGGLKLETAEKKIANIDRVESTTRGKIGEVQMRKVRKVRITNEQLIPRRYLVPDMVAIRRDALGGTAIDGVEVYEEETVAVGSY